MTPASVVPPSGPAMPPSGSEPGARPDELRGRAWRQVLLGLAGLLVFASVVSASVLVLWRWQLRAYPEWAARRPVPAEESFQAMHGREGAPMAPLPGDLATPPQPSAKEGVSSHERAARPRLAIVIDDWGYDWQAADSFFALDVPLTVAVIPFLPHSRQQALEARRRGFEVLVHLPMQPQDPRLDPGPNAITTDLPDDEIRRRVELAIEAVPGAVGVSNHMGSRATADRRVMVQVLAAVARRGLFFLDSHTTPDSVVGAVAREFGMPWAQNDLFLDGERDVLAVRRRLELGARRALSSGHAIVIGHVRPATAAAVASILPELQRRGIEVVPVSDLLQR